MENEQLAPEVQSAVTQLTALDAENGIGVDANPEPTEAEKQEQADKFEFDEMTAAFTAQMGLASLEASLKFLLHPRFEFSESAKAEALAKFAPMLVKYGLLLPEFIMQYQQEIEAAKAAFVLAKDGYNNVVELRQEDALTVAQEQNETEQETEQSEAA